MSKTRQRELRQMMTPPEQAMWRLLKPFRDSGVHFRRQAALGPYFADFAVLGLKLVIEVDGDTHHIGQGPAHDARRDDYLKQRGFRVLRFSNTDVLNAGEGVYLEIERTLIALGGQIPFPQGGGERSAPNGVAPAYTLRDAKDEDTDWVAWLEEHCMRAYAEVLWGRWRSAIVQYGFVPERHRIVVLEGMECGVIGVRKFPDHHYLSRLYLAENVRGNGLGSALLKQVREEAGSANLPLRLSVLTTNPRAQAFYARQGCVVTARNNEHIVMECRA